MIKHFFQSFVSGVHKNKIFSDNMDNQFVGSNEKSAVNIKSNNLMVGSKEKSSALSASGSNSIKPVISNHTKMMDCIKQCSRKHKVPTQIINYSFPPLVYLNSLKSRNLKPTLMKEQMIKNDYVSQSISEQERSKYIERIPRNHFGAHESQMGISFRFIPGLTTLMHHVISIPFNLDRLISIWNSFSSSFTSIPFSHPTALLSYSHQCAGFRRLVNERYNKFLVEVVTFHNGMHGHFVALVGIGVSCTVWYLFAPGLPGEAPPSEIFPVIQSYTPFLQADYCPALFKKVCFLETNDPTLPVLSGLMEKPFSKLNLHTSNSNVIVAVGIGVMVAFFLSLGISPNAESITI